MKDKERNYWIAFSTFIPFGTKRFGLLRKYFGGAENAWKSSEKELTEIGLSPKLVSSFLAHRTKFSLENYLENLAKSEIVTITSEDQEYPALLKEITDPPFILYIKSKSVIRKTIADFFEGLTLAVVGSRKITAYGQEVTERLVADLVFNGLTIVSGMARGVDSIAHKTAIENRGKTIAVLGSGVDIIYPPENVKLYNQITENGMVISEFPLGYPAMKQNFPIRNRIISGLSLGVLVTEAAEDSGSLITASCAGEQGRDVFAVPGPITSFVSRGTSELLKKGAKLVTAVSDILEELKVNEKKHIQTAKKVLPTSKNEKLILDILSSGSVHINSIVVKSKLPVAEVGSILTVMEMKGVIKSYGNGIYGRYQT